jgi:hypothetical protein
MSLRLEAHIVVTGVVDTDGERACVAYKHHL